MNEIWKDIAGYDGLYQVSNFGNVYSFKRNKQLKPSKQKIGGYMVIGLSKENKPKQHYVHRLVAEHFIPNSNHLPEVNHIKVIDGKTDKSDNSVGNLEWSSHANNMKHAAENGLMINAGNKAALSLKQKEKILALYNSGLTQMKIAEIFGVTQVTISRNLKSI